MNAFSRSVSRIFKGAAKAFQTFPAVIACAIAFSVVALIRIQLDWPEQEAYNFLFNCLQWAFALGAAFSLAAITLAQSRFNGAKAFWIANLSGFAATAATFLALYFAGGTVNGASEYRSVSVLAGTRVSVVIFVCMLAFVVLAGYPKDRSDFSRSLFMAQKAFFIAAIYGVVLMGGFSGVAGAVQALLYRDMSEKVYMDLGTLAGFLAFTVFVGYFPDFRRGETDEHRESAQKQPRFIEILFGYIMVPIVLALTVVLLLWAGKTVVTGTWPSFEQLAGIAAAYAAGGIWLHIMVTRYETGIAGFYRRVYPIAALVILAFEAWALAVQLGKWGLRTTEYIFLLLWVVTAAASVLLIFMREKAHTIIAAVLCAVAVFSVLPAVGYHALPVAEQTARLERLLTENGMFEDGKIVPAVSEPERSVRESVTETVSFLAYAEDAKLPAWFVEDLNLSSVFRETFGFEQIWPQDEDATGVDEGDYLSTYLTLPSGAVDIGGYRWAVNPVGYKTETGQDSVTIDGDRGTYRIYWTQDYEDGIPNLKITLNDDVILEEDLSGYIDRITEAFPPSVGGTAEATLADMSVQLESPEITVLLVFSDVSISVDTRLNAVSYWFDLSALYLNEKP